MHDWQMSSQQCEVGLNESYSPTAGSVINWHAVWTSVAADLNSDTFAPKFLTEDGIRRTTLRALNSQLDVLRHVEIEYPSVNLSGDKLGRLDLVVSPMASATVIEFKYPREPRQKLPPWPDHLGGVLSDTYRLGILAAGPKVHYCIQVVVSADAFLGYVRRTMTRCALATYIAGEQTPREIALTPERTVGLADTTRRSLKDRDRFWRVTADRSVELAIGNKGLWLSAYAVTAKGSLPQPVNNENSQ